MLRNIVHVLKSLSKLVNCNMSPTVICEKLSNTNIPIVTVAFTIMAILGPVAPWTRDASGPNRAQSVPVLLVGSSKKLMFWCKMERSTFVRIRITNSTPDLAKRVY